MITSEKYGDGQKSIFFIVKEFVSYLLCIFGIWDIAKHPPSPQNSAGSDFTGLLLWNLDLFFRICAFELNLWKIHTTSIIFVSSNKQKSTSLNFPMFSTKFFNKKSQDNASKTFCSKKLFLPLLKLCSLPMMYLWNLRYCKASSPYLSSISSSRIVKIDFNHSKNVPSPTTESDLWEIMEGRPPPARLESVCDRGWWDKLGRRMASSSLLPGVSYVTWKKYGFEFTNT